MPRMRSTTGTAPQVGSGANGRLCRRGGARGPRQPRLAVCLVACCFALSGWDRPCDAQAVVMAPNCGVAAVADYCALRGYVLSPQDALTVENMFRGTDASMLEILRAAGSLGFHLRGVRAGLDALGRVPGPKIIHLRDPDHFAVISQVSAEWVQFAGVQGAVVVPRDEVQRRYSGYALTADGPERKHGPRLLLHRFCFPLSAPTDEKGDDGRTVNRVRQEVAFSNAGDGALEVTAVEGCCGSPSALLAGTVATPGKPLEGLLIYDVPSSGNVMASSKFLTNDPDQPVVYLTLHGYTPAAMHVQPEHLAVFAEKGAEVRRSLVVYGPPGLRIGAVSSQSGLTRAAFHELDTEGDASQSAWVIDVTLSASTTPGTQEDFLRIETNQPDRSSVIVPVRCEARGELEASPRQVFFGILSPGQSARRTMTIYSRTKRPFHIGGVASADKRVRVSPPVADGDTWRFEVSLGPEDPGVIDSVVDVSSDVRGEEVVRLPVYADIRREGPH